MIDRRKHLRIPSNYCVNINGQCYPIHDLSKGGFSIKIDNIEHFNKNQDVWFSAIINKLPKMWGLAKIRWITERLVGLEFVFLDLYENIKHHLRACDVIDYNESDKQINSLFTDYMEYCVSVYNKGIKNAVV